MSVPQTHQVTVSSAGQESTTGRPPETTDVPRPTVDRTDVEPGLADVVVVNVARLGGGGEEVGARVPGQGVDSRVVGVHGPHKLLGVDIPELLRQGEREYIIMYKYSYYGSLIFAVHCLVCPRSAYIHTVHVKGKIYST